MAKYVRIEKLGELGYKKALGRMLSVRDNLVLKIAPDVLRPALIEWQSIAPYKTGFTRNQMEIKKKNKYINGIMLKQAYRPPRYPGDELKSEKLVINVLYNRNADVRRWYSQVRNNFYAKVKSDYH